MKASIKSSGQSLDSGKGPAPRNPNEVVIRDHHKRSESVTATKDPHASLSLFAERDPNDNGRTYSGPKHETAY